MLCLHLRQFCVLIIEQHALKRQQKYSIFSVEEHFLLAKAYPHKAVKCLFSDYHVNGILLVHSGMWVGHEYYCCDFGGFE